MCRGRSACTPPGPRCPADIFLDRVGFPHRFLFRIGLNVERGSLGRRKFIYGGSLSVSAAADVTVELSGRNVRVAQACAGFSFLIAVPSDVRRLSPLVVANSGTMPSLELSTSPQYMRFGQLS